jgi:selenocysteine lyase/cysteine desulfurase
VRRRIVACEPFDSFDERLLAAAREATPDIVFVSHVMFRSGLRFDDVEALAALARHDATWVIVDSYHSFMAIACDFGVAADRVFLLGGGYKYAMTGEGAGWIHAPPDFAPRPQNTGWFADFGAMEQKQSGVAFGRDGSRFLGATFDATGLYRFNAVRAMLAQEGLDTAAIGAHCDALRVRMQEAIVAGDAGRLAEAEILQPNAQGPQPRFLALRHTHATRWKATLFEHDAITDARDDVLRIGFGLYQDEADVAAFCARAREALG